MNRPSCIVVGEGTLPVRCAAVLLEQGFRLKGLACTEAETRQAAAEAGIETSDDLASLASAGPFDYLLCINHREAPPTEVRTAATKLAIAYHDSLLPAYAGRNASSWAIAQREARHGISWYVLSETPYAGPLLEQREVPLSPDDRAFTLKARCEEAALEALGKLAAALKTGEPTLKQIPAAAQGDLSSEKRPPANGIIAWENDAEAIDALVRSLEFGVQANPLARPKVLVDRRPVAVERLRILDTSSTNPPGTVLAVQPECLVVATLSRDVEIELAHAPVLELRKGDRLPRMLSAEVDAITGLNEATCQSEGFWRDELLRQEPYLPAATAKAAETGAEWASIVTTVEEQQILALQSLVGHPADGVIAALLVLLCREQSGPKTCGYTEESLWEDADITLGLFAQQVPLTVCPGAAENAEQALVSVCEQLVLIRRHRTFALDLLERCPELRARPEISANAPTLISLGTLQVRFLPARCRLLLTVDRSGGAVEWRFDPALVERTDIERHVNDFARLLEALTAAPQQAIGALVSG